MGSTQRLFSIVIFLNVIIGLVGVIHVAPATKDTGALTQQIGQYGEGIQDFKDVQDKDIRDPDVNEPTTPFNTVTQGGNIWSFIEISINPWSVSPNMFEKDIEKALAGGLAWIRTMLLFLVALEVFMLFWSKKQS